MHCKLRSWFPGYVQRSRSCSPLELPTSPLSRILINMNIQCAHDPGSSSSSSNRSSSRQRLGGSTENIWYRNISSIAILPGG